MGGRLADDWLSSSVISEVEWGSSIDEERAINEYSILDIRYSIFIR